MSGLDAQWLEPDWPAPARIRAISTLRGGGVSRGPYASLNLGGRSGDEAAAVAENRRRLSAAAGLPGEPAWLAQVHGARVIDLDAAERGGRDAPGDVMARSRAGAGERMAESRAGVGGGVAETRTGTGGGIADTPLRAAEAGAGAPSADASVTARAGVVCAILTADCMPVLLTSDSGDVVAAAHAGWRGLAGGVIEATVAAMAAKLEAARSAAVAASGTGLAVGAHLGVLGGAGVAGGAGSGEAGRGAPVAAPGAAAFMAWLGPAIGPRHFEVGPEVLEAMLEGDPGAGAAFRPGARGRYMADLELLARRRLEALGIRRIYGGGRCTFDDRLRYFSHRRDQGTTGRHATLIWLNSGPASPN